MVKLLASLAGWAADVLLRAAMDKALGSAISEAISVAESAGLSSGEAKMKRALREVRHSGVEALANETESRIRTKIEQALDRL